MPDPRTPEFWAKEGDELWSLIVQLAMQAMTGGAAGAVALLPEGPKQLFSWDIFNQDAIDFLRSYRLDVVDDISVTTQNQAVAAIEEWIKQGEHLDALEARLIPIFGPERAHRIAVTEVTRLYAAGNQVAWMGTGVVHGKVWQTSQDERVCLICKPLHNQVVELEASFSIPLDQMTPELARRALQLGDEFHYAHPPAHVNCRCYLKPFVDEVQLQEDRQRRLGLVP